MDDLIFNNGALKIGYNRVPWSFSYDKTDEFFHECNPTTREVGSFREEAIIAATEIRKAYGMTPLYAMYSGGVDSEAMMEAFRLANVPVITVLVKFTDGSNQHDLKHAYEYLKKINQTDKVLVIPFNIKDWLSSQECIDFSKEMQSEPILTHLFKVANDHLRDGIMMTAHEEPSLWREKEQWVWNRHEKHYGMHKYFIKEKLSGVPSFFQWSTELLCAFIFNKHYNAVYQNLFSPTIYNAEQLKYSFYYDEFKLASRSKYTGFEFLLSEILETNIKFTDGLPLRWNRELNTEVYEWGKLVNYRKKS